MNWHHISLPEIFELTGSSREGLNTLSAEIKLAEYGYNELQGKKKKPAWQILIRQLMDVMILILIAAAVISGLLGDFADTLIILVIVVLNAIVGFFQEYKAEKALDALKKMAALQARVIREHRVFELPAAKLVPGDVVLLDAGNAVPADVRLLHAHTLFVDESALTGESLPVEKNAQVIPEPDALIGDRVNMAYKGTLVTTGRATGIVVATGMNTELGLIARMLQGAERITPLQIRIADFGRKLSYIILFICVLIFTIGWFRGEDPLKMLLLSISLAVAAIPEALPALITVALAQGAQRMVRNNALIRKLTAVETLGSVSYICSDKTGTLTQNRMKVKDTIAFNPLHLPEAPEIPLLDLLIVLNNDVNFDDPDALGGDPTEIALIEWALGKYGTTKLKQLRTAYPRVAELPFDADRRCMTTVHRFQEAYLVVSKGAIESIIQSLAESDMAAPILEKNHSLAEEGARVLGYGYKILDSLPEPFHYEAVEHSLLIAGLAGMIDPPREEVPQAIADCQAAGIHPVMITGDHPATAKAIARKIGLLREQELVITGKELQQLSSSEFDAQVERIRVYARVSPEQKVGIVKALQKRNHFVAMTGDGVNDAPSLKLANIGIAMGVTGTDVSREAAHMILLDDNFATVVKAVKEGRRIYDNIRKFVKYIMTCNGAEIWTIFLASFIGLPIPLLPIQILWINLVTDGLPGLALASEAAEKDIMKRPPRASTESLFANGVGLHILWVGLLMAGVTLGLQAWAMTNSPEHWQTMVFTVLSISQLGHVMAVRSERTFLYQQGILSNSYLFLAVAGTLLLQITVIYLPAFNTLFKTTPLTIRELALCLALASVVFHAVELEKWIKNRRGEKNVIKK